MFELLKNCPQRAVALRRVWPYCRTLAVTSALCAAVASTPSLAAVPTDGGEWAIGAGETESLDTAATISRLAVDGSLTLDAGAALTATGKVVNCISTGDGIVADMTIASGASLTSQGSLTGANPANTQGFSIGTYGGTGTVTVASGGTLTVTGGRLFLARNNLAADATSFDRTKLSHGILNIFGTVSAPTVECSAWFPTRDTSITYDLDTLPVASVINLEEGGVLETGIIYNDDLARDIINFKGGTLRLTREANPLISASVSTIWNIEEGKNLIFDSQSYHANLNPALHQPDSFKITGAGGLVKKGTGYLRICMSHPEMNTFTGPIVVEAGYLSIGRPLAEGQMVLVKSGAVFYPVAPSDLPKITYEDPDDAPENGSVYVVNLPIYGGLDLLGMSPTYATDKIATTTWGWGGEVHGAITHSADISLEHPFGLVGQGRTLTLDGTGLDDLPLTVSGTGTFAFSGNHTNTTDSAITFTGTATYQQSGYYNVQGENGAMPVTTISGGGTFKTTGDLRAGYDGRDGAIVVSNGANVTVGGNLRLGSNASTRYSVKGRMEINNATVTVTGAVNMGANGLTDGSDLETLMNELVLGPGATLNMGSRFQHNDDPRSRITFAGGLVKAESTQADFFYCGQNGILEIEAKDGNDIRLNIGGYNIGATSKNTHFFGTGGLAITGTGSASTFTLGKAGLTDFSVAYSGATKLTNCTLCLNVPLPAGSTVTGTGSTLFLNNVTTTNNVVGDVTVKGSGALVVGADGADCAFSNKIEGVTLVKEGAGTLTLDRPFDGNLVVKGGTAVVRGAAYKSYRFKVEAMRSASPDCMQFSELVFYRGSEDVTRPYAGIGFSTKMDTVTRTYSATESPSNVVDGTVSTKWCDSRGGTAASAIDREQLWVRIDYAAPKLITGYAWYTANDRDGRDPSAWRLQGSNDGGATWTDIDVRSGFTATTTRKALAFQCTLPGPSGVLGSTSHVVVQPGATLRLSGGAVPASAIKNNGGTVELADGATLTSDGGVLDGDVSGAGSLGVYGGNVTLAGEQTYTGDTHVFGGTLNVGAATNPLPRTFDGKYFRLTFKRSNGGNSANKSPYTATGNGIQASEFQLYSTEGVNQCQGLTEATAGTPAQSLAASKFACDRVHSTGSSETYAKLFDGDTGTKLYTADPGVDGTPANWHVVVMRLADSAAPVAAYNFYTANDYVRRSPSDWTLEGSRDGVTWELLDERRWAPHTTFTGASGYSAAAIQKKPFNNGVNYQFETDVPQTFSGKFLRFTFKKTAGNTSFQLSELMVFDAFGNNVAKGLAEAANNTAAANLAPGSFTCPENYYNSAKSEGPKYLFDDNVHTKICNGTVNGTAANYRYITIRLSDYVTSVSGYMFVTANDSLNRSPSDWMVEGSVDGNTWTTLDERSGIAQPYCLYTAMNAGHPFTFTAAARESAALPAGSVVTVDAGATLNLNDADATIGALRVDCAAGAGTINSFRPAAGGTLELVNVPAGTSIKGYVLPITITDVQDAANLRRWRVTVNGRPCGYKPVYRDGGITFLSGGIVVIVR